MPQSGEYDPSHLSSALTQAVDHGPQHVLQEALTSRAQTGGVATLCFQELKANYKKEDKKRLIFMILWYHIQCLSN